MSIPALSPAVSGDVRLVFAAPDAIEVPLATVSESLRRFDVVAALSDKKPSLEASGANLISFSKQA